MIIRKYNLILKNKDIFLKLLKLYYESLNGTCLKEKLKKTSIGIKILLLIEKFKNLEDLNENNAINTYDELRENGDLFYEVMDGDKSIAIFILQLNRGDIIYSYAKDESVNSVHVPFVLLTEDVTLDESVKIVDLITDFSNELAIKYNREYSSVNILTRSKKKFINSKETMLIQKNGK